MTSDSPLPSVLIVEDDTMVLATLKLTLEMQKLEVITCDSPVEALQLVDQRDFAVIISDFRMRQMTGLEFLNECRKRRPHCFRILFTAVANVFAVEDAVKGGEISRLITKPWKREQLVAAVKEGIQIHDLGAKNQAPQEA
jgi:DNA-binding NtrC family response regulator